MQTVLEATKTFRPSLAQKAILVPHPLPKSEVAAVPSISGVPAGTTTNFVVYYDPQLDRKGKALAKAILDDCEREGQPSCRPSCQFWSSKTSRRGRGDSDI